MAEQSPHVQFEDVPLEEARRMSRGPRMEPMLYDTLRQKIQALSSEATRIHLGPEIRPERMKHYLLRIARELNVPLTVRRVPGVWLNGFLSHRGKPICFERSGVVMARWCPQMVIRDKATGTAQREDLLRSAGGQRWTQYARA
jgi:hypothetical protein